MTLKWILSFPDVGQPASANRFDFQLDDVAFTVDSFSGGGVGPVPVPPIPPVPVDGVPGSIEQSLPIWR